jgi:hypothetical protein
MGVVSLILRVTHPSTGNLIFVVAKVAFGPVFFEHFRFPCQLLHMLCSLNIDNVVD